MQLWLEQFWRDIRFGVRHLAKAPAVSILAVVSLAAGVMATTAIYSVVHAVILDPFPYKDVDRLMSVRVSAAAQRGGRTGYSVDQFLEIADRSHDLRRRHRIDHQRCPVGYGSRARAPARQSRDLQYLRRDGRAAPHRPHACGR